jgi:hypothetical protein
VQGLLHGFGLFQLVNAAVQGPGKLGGIEGCCALSPALFLQSSSPLVQFAQPPGGFERLAVVALVVQDRAADVRHRKAAQAAIAFEVEGLHGPNQPEASRRNQFVKGLACLLTEAVGNLAHEGQIFTDQGIAPVEAQLGLFGLVGLGQGLEPLLVSSPKLGLDGGGLGHGAWTMETPVGGIHALCSFGLWRPPGGGMAPHRFG